jgi:hypothetical protein
VRFANVNGEEFSTVFVIIVEFGKVTYLAAKGRSGVASKNEDERALPNAVMKSKSRLAIESDEFDVGRLIASSQIAPMPVRKRVTQKAVHVARAAHQITQAAVSEQQDHNQRDRSPFPPAHFQTVSCNFKR